MSKPAPAAAPNAPAAKPTPAPAPGGDLLADIAKLRTPAATETEQALAAAPAEPAAEGELAEAAPAEPTEPEAAAPTPPEPAKPAEDAQFAKNLAALQAERQKNHRELTARKAELDKQANEIAADREAIKSWRAAKANIRTDVYGFLLASGLDEGHMEEALKIAYQTSKSATPEMRARAAEAKRAIESETRIQRLEREAKERVEAAEKRQTDMDERERVNGEKAVLKSLIPGLAAKAPLVAEALKNSEQLTLTELYAHIPQYVEEHGENPTGEQLVEYVEGLTRKTLARFGLDAAALAAPKAANAVAPKTTTPVAGKTPTAKTLGNDLATPTRPKVAKNRDEEVADVLAEMKAGRAVVQE